MRAAVKVLSAGARTIGEALEAWLRYLAEGEKAPRTLELADYYVRRLFPRTDETPLSDLASEATCRQAYKALRESGAQSKSGKLSTDTHRQALTYAKMFGKWCASPPQSWIKASGLAAVQGIGKKKKGARSKQQLTIDEARAFLATCITSANDGDQGAVAAMMTLLMGLRAGEVAKRIVRNVDNGGTMLWVTETKTEAGERCLRIPKLLQPYLAALIQGKDREASIWDYARNGAGRATGKVLNALRAAYPEPVSPPQLAKATGVDIEVVYTICIRLARNGSISRAGRGWYQHRDEVVTTALARRREPRTQAPNRSWVLKAVKRMCALAGTPTVTAQGNRGFNATLKTIGGLDALLATVAREHGHTNSQVTKDHYIDPAGLNEAGTRAVESILTPEVN